MGIQTPCQLSNFHHKPNLFKMSASLCFNPLPTRTASKVTKRGSVAQKMAVAPKRAVPLRTVTIKASMPKKVQQAAPAAAAAAFASMIPADQAFAAQEIAQTAMETNILGLVATALFIIIPTAFLITLFISSQASGNVAGGFDQDYYTKSRADGKKETNLTAIFKGEGVEMYSKPKDLKPPK